MNGIEINQSTEWRRIIDLFQGGDRYNHGLWSDPRENDRMYMRIVDMLVII
jgi:hypothetical protein